MTTLNGQTVCSPYTLSPETMAQVWAYHSARFQNAGLPVPHEARIILRNGVPLADMFLPLRRLAAWMKLARSPFNIRARVTENTLALETLCEQRGTVLAQALFRAQSVKPPTGIPSEPIVLEAPEQGGPFTLLPNVADSVSTLCAEAAKTKRTGKARKALSKAVKEALAVRYRFKEAAADWRNAVAVLERQTLPQAISTAKRKRRVLAFLRAHDGIRFPHVQIWDAPDWLNGKGIYKYSVARARAVEARRALLMYRPPMRKRYSWSAPECVRGPKYDALVNTNAKAEQHLAVVLLGLAEKHLRTLGVHDYKWNYANTRPYSAARRIVRDWPRKRALLLNDWNNALAAYRKQKGKLKAIIG